MAEDDCKDGIKVDQDQLIGEVQSFAGQTRIMSVAARGLARPLLDQMAGARRRDALRAGARYGTGSAKTRQRVAKAEAAGELRQNFETAFVTGLAEAPAPDDGQSGVYGTVTRGGVPQDNLQVGIVTDKGTWRGYGCTDSYGAYSFTLPARATGTLRVQEKSGVPLFADATGFPVLAEGQSLRRDIELDASGSVCPEPGPVDDTPEPEPETVTVPDLVGQSEDSAQALLKEAGLNRGTRTSMASDAEPGTVTAQSPAAGSAVAPGSAVDITVAEEQQAVMPDVTGVPVSLARETLKAAGLSSVTETEDEAPNAVGLVIAQTPQPGTPIGPETDVTLTVGTAADLQMPDLTGQKIEEAQSVLENIGVKEVETVEQTSDDGVGLVISQMPEPGTVITADTLVTLTVGVAEALTMPRVLGQKAKTAQQRLQRLGLTSIAFEEQLSEDSAGLVISQDPKPGTNITSDTAVTLVIGVADTLQMPDLREITPARARSNLREFGITKVTVAEQTAPEAVGLVVDHDPKPGDTVTTDTAVTLFVGIAAEDDKPSTDMRAILEVMAEDPNMKERELTAADLEKHLESRGVVTVEDATRISGMTLARASTALSIDNKAEARDIARAMRNAVKAQ